MYYENIKMYSYSTFPKGMLLECSSYIVPMAWQNKHLFCINYYLLQFDHTVMTVLSPLIVHHLEIHVI